MTDENQSTGPIVRLFGSSKAIVVMAVTALSFASLWTHQASWDQIEGLLKWLIAPWLVAVGIEDAARHVAVGIGLKRMDPLVRQSARPLGQADLQTSGRADTPIPVSVDK